MHFHDPCQHQPTPSYWTMMAPTKEDEFMNSAFFASQSQKLQALLQTVVHESTTATNPDAAIDFLQLTEIISSLLEECQMYSMLTSGDLGERRQDVRKFMSRIETVEGVIGDWGVRIPPATMNGEVTGKRKRARASTGTQNDHDTRANRRRLESETELALTMGSTFDGGEDVEMGMVEENGGKEQTAWWTEPYYD